MPASVEADQMAVRLVYENDFDTTGDGFHRFVDQQEGAKYVYTNFEPFEAHWLFPCLDQPDIKGRYAFEVTAPAAWTVVANSPVESIDQVADGPRHHRFAETDPSAYISQQSPAARMSAARWSIAALRWASMPAAAHRNVHKNGALMLGADGHRPWIWMP